MRSRVPNGETEPTAPGTTPLELTDELQRR